METAKVVSEAEELPKAIVRRVVKEKLSQCSDAGDISLHKDALLAFSESARIFIHYLSFTANDICKESKRQTISADDVLKAVEEIEFPKLIEPLKASLAALELWIFENEEHQANIYDLVEQYGHLLLEIPLEGEYYEFRRKNAGKRAEASKIKELKKRKADSEPSQAKESGKKKKDEGTSDSGKEETNDTASDD